MMFLNFWPRAPQRVEGRIGALCPSSHILLSDRVEFISLVLKILQMAKGLWYTTRDIWKVLTVVFYPSNQITNSNMFCILLKNYHSSMLWHKFQEDIIMQTLLL